MKNLLQVALSALALSSSVNARAVPEQGLARREDTLSGAYASHLGGIEQRSSEIAWAAPDKRSPKGPPNQTKPQTNPNKPGSGTPSDSSSDFFDPYADKGKPFYNQKGKKVLEDTNGLAADKDQMDLESTSAAYQKSYKNSKETGWDIEEETEYNTVVKIRQTGFDLPGPDGYTLYETSSKSAGPWDIAFRNAYGFKKGPRGDKFHMVALDQQGFTDTNQLPDRVSWTEGRAYEINEVLKSESSTGATTKNGGVVTRYHIVNSGTQKRIDAAIEAKTDKKPGMSTSKDDAVSITPEDGDLWIDLVGTDNVRGSVYQFGAHKKTFGDLKLTKIDVWPEAADANQKYGMNLWFDPA